MKYVALYCRLSPRPDGSYEGVDLQEKWGREYAAQAWPDQQVKAFPDAGISAANGDTRPAFEELRAALGQGEVGHLWCVEQTRLERTEVGWFQFAAELDAAGITEVHTNRDGIVRVRDEVAGIKAVIAAGEVRRLKKRVNDKLDAIAAEGRPAGGTVFGYRRGLDSDGKKTLVVVPEQAEALRDAAEKVLAGWSLARVAARLAEQGYRGARGAAINSSTARKMLTNATVAGRRIHRGHDVGRGTWVPILDEQTWDAVRDRLAQPRTVIRSDGGEYPLTALVRSTGRRYLLTGGIARCGVCGAAMVGTMKQLKTGVTKPYYQCHPNRGGRACVGIMGDPFEAYVVQRLLAELDKPEFTEALAVDQHADERDRITAALRGIENRRNQLAADFGAGDLTSDEYRAARQANVDRERQLRVDLAAVPAPVAHVDVSLIREGWDAMNLDERREVLGMFIESVVVKRATPGLQAFDENRVGVSGIVWRQR